MKKAKEAADMPFPVFPLERHNAIRDQVANAFFSKRPFRIDDRVFAPCLPHNGPLVVVDASCDEIMLVRDRKVAEETPVSWSSPRWAVCHWDEALMILRNVCHYMLDFDNDGYAREAPE